MGIRQMASELGLLLDLLDEAYDRKAWHGPNLRGALRGLSAEQAAWRPARGRHAIWDIALHCAYWKYAVRRRLVGGGKRGAFPRPGSNWPRLPERLDAAAWKADVGLLDAMHRDLRTTVAAFPASRLTERLGRSSAGQLISGVAVATAATRGQQAGRLIYGIAAHDLYHAGQIRLLIRLQGAKREAR